MLYTCIYIYICDCEHAYVSVCLYWFFLCYCSYVTICECVAFMRCISEYIYIYICR